MADKKSGKMNPKTGPGSNPPETSDAASESIGATVVMRTAATVVMVTAVIVVTATAVTAATVIAAAATVAIVTAVAVIADRARGLALTVRD